MIARAMLHNALRLGAFAVVATGLIAGVNALTQARIADSQQQALVAQLHQLVPAAQHDNDLLTDTVPVADPAALGYDRPRMAWRARWHGQAVALVLPVIAPDGYSGRIELLVGINADGTLAGVRTVTHKETPGLGDYIDLSKSDWILSFTGKSLTRPTAAGWAVKKDGGDFDQFTGATITPRAVVRAVHRALVWYQAHRATLFAEPIATTGAGA